MPANSRWDLIRRLRVNKCVIILRHSSVTFLNVNKLRQDINVNKLRQDINVNKLRQDINATKTL